VAERARQPIRRQVPGHVDELDPDDRERHERDDDEARGGPIGDGQRARGGAVARGRGLLGRPRGGQGALAPGGIS
jgi:hypothetical protein